MDEELGLLSYEVVLNSNLSMGNSLIKRGQEILGNLYSKTKDMLIENIEYLHALANKLIIQESLSEKEIDEVIASVESQAKCS